ncbi:MAG: hypothetical protein GY722_24230 [bacterium]|nr:hypothetical protein [bacterium]
MSAALSDAWLRLFPAPRISDVLSYVNRTWDMLQETYAAAVAFDHDEPKLTDNLCEALNQTERRLASQMDCDFQPETRELRRNHDGSTSYIARADIRVILGAPGTPQLVLEFKKLNGTTEARYRYCFDGISRFVEGKYAVGHKHGVMCGFVCVDVETETEALAAYIADGNRALRLGCLAKPGGTIVERPSVAAPADARFDTTHRRKASNPDLPIVVLHVLLPCSPAE